MILQTGLDLRGGSAVTQRTLSCGCPLITVVLYQLPSSGVLSSPSAAPAGRAVAGRWDVSAVEAHDGRLTWHNQATAALSEALSPTFNF